MAREINKLHPRLQDLITKLIIECNKQGLKIGISECVRTVSEQDTLYSYGRTDKSRGKVTNAKGSTYSSMHQWFIAFDFYRNDGKGAYNDSDGFFTKVGKIGQKLGLEWGGAWISIKDKPHFQLSEWGSTPSKLRKEYGVPDKFKLSWANKPTQTITKDSSKEDIMWLQTNLNKCLKGVKGFVPLVVDGGYGKKTCDAVKLYWKQLKWNKDGLDDGSRSGKSTINALDTGRIK